MKRLAQPARDLAPVVRAFRIPGEIESIEPWGSGHINDTYRVTTVTHGNRRHFLLQRINRRVFADPAAVTETIRRTTAHLRSKLGEAGAHDLDRRVLTLVETRGGQVCHRSETGDWWRVTVFVTGARSHDVVSSPRMAKEAAFAFGCFQRDLADLPPPRLPETIPGFHDTPARFRALRAAVETNVAGRGREAAPEITFALAREETTGVLLDAGLRGEIPERITHNDTKINNVLFDDATGEAICVIDLDTVMPGLGLHDFGDMVRTSTCTAREDERDLDRVEAQPDLFAALVEGYVSAMGPYLTRTEKDLLAFSGRVITFEVGLRFLADHLQGDVYFKTDRPGHNLDRCRAQFALLRSLEAQDPDFRRIVREGP